MSPPPSSHRRRRCDSQGPRSPGDVGEFDDHRPCRAGSPKLHPGVGGRGAAGWPCGTLEITMKTDHPSNPARSGRGRAIPTPVALAPRSVPVGRGRTVIVRHVESNDAGALYRLYDELDADDRYLRFFCAYRPDDAFIGKLANPGPREARVVAELVESGHRRLVAEAGYSLLENGNGEFAMVVARDWRGWLGPYLLDLVIDIAGANHVPNLEAEV